MFYTTPVLVFPSNTVIAHYKTYYEQNRYVTNIFINLPLGHISNIIHLEISIQKISLVLSCEPHPKCKLKATDNCIKRTLRKVNNPCNRGYKHHCFPPCGNRTSPRLMFLSLKLVIRGHEPTIEHNVLSWSHYLLLGQSNKQQRRTCKNYLGTKI